MGNLSERLTLGQRVQDFTQWRFGVLIMAVLLILLSWISLLSPEMALTHRHLLVSGTPMEFIVSKNAKIVPGVLVAHGYCGSKQLMLGYASTLAHNGYGVMLWDLPGHGANTHPFVYDALQSSFDVPFSTLKSQPEIDPSQLAVIGHSMGSGIAMEGAIARSNEIDAVIAISPTGAPVTPDTPNNLSLQLGAWETFLQENANRILRDAGGENLNLAQGKGRSLSVIKNAEHATILFKDQSHQETLDWLNQTFGLDQNNTFRDRRMVWYGLHLLGWLLCLGSVLPRFVPQSSHSIHLTKWRAWVGLLFAPCVGAVVLKLVNDASPVENMGGLMIGGALGLWFLIIGVVWLGMIGQLPRPKSRDLSIGVIGFIGLWFGFGAMAQVTWLPWFLSGYRLWLWGLTAIACIPWFLASSLFVHSSTIKQSLGKYLAQCIAIIGGLALTLMAVPNLGFLAIMFPAFPILFGIFSVLQMRVNSIWATTVSSALIFSWLIVVPFPVI